MPAIKEQDVLTALMSNTSTQQAAQPAQAIAPANSAVQWTGKANEILTNINRSLRLAQQLIENPLVAKTLPEPLRKKLEPLISKQQEQQRFQPDLKTVNNAPAVKPAEKKKESEPMKEPEIKDGKVLLSSEEIYQLIIVVLDFGISQAPNITVSQLRQLAEMNKDGIMQHIEGYINGLKSKQ